MAKNCFFSQAHEPEYVKQFLSGVLNDKAKRRIGFGDVIDDPVLVERTQSEVAGKVSARFEMPHPTGR